MVGRSWIGSLVVAVSATAAAQDAGAVGLGAVSVPAADLARYAPPPLDPAVTRRVQAMLDVRSPGIGALPSDGRHLYFGWNVTGVPEAWVLDGPRAFPVQLTGGEDQTFVEDVTPDGKWVLLSRDVGGQENFGLYAQPAGGGPLKVIQRIDKVRTILDLVDEDSRTVYFHSNDLKPDSYTLYSYDLVTGQRTLVTDEPGLWGIVDKWGKGDDLRLLLRKATGSMRAEFWEWTAKTRKVAPLLGVGEDIDYQAAYSTRPDTLLVQTNRFADFRRLYLWKVGTDASAASFKQVSPDVKMDGAGFTIDRARRHVYLSLNEGGYQRLVVLDAKTFAQERLPIPKDVDWVEVGSPTVDGRYLVLGFVTGRAPTTSYVWDWKRRKLTQWVVPSAPEVDLGKFVPAQLMHYPARDGTPIPMFVRFPAGCGPQENPGADPCPVVVEFHGGPESQADAGFNSWAQLFVDAGFVFVEPNVRGSFGFGKRWLDADNGPKRLDVITDIDDCGKWIRANWVRHGKAPRVGIEGGSYGGYSALVGMTLFAGTYDAGASVVGMSSLTTFLRNTSAYRRILRINEYGDPDKDADALAKLSPINYLDRVKAPLLLIQGVNDPRVPASEAIQIQEALEKRGIPSRLILIPDEGHGSAKRWNRVIQQGQVLRFLEEKLKS